MHPKRSKLKNRDSDLWSHYVVIGTRSIRKVLGVSHKTLMRWIERDYFPAAKLSDGRYAISYGAIDNWITARYLAGRTARGLDAPQERTEEADPGSRDGEG